MSRELKQRKEQFGNSLSNLSPSRMVESSEAYRLLDALESSESLLSIIKRYVTLEREKDASLTVLELFRMFLESREHLTYEHRRQIEGVGRKLKLSLERDFKVSQIEPAHIEQALSGLSGGTRNHYIKIIRSVFAYGVLKGYLKENPAIKVDKTHMPRKAIKTFSNATICGMLNLALETEPRMVSYIALASFAGLRVGSPELLRLKWDHIHFDEKEILVPESLSKVKRRRFIKISPNLEAWLNLILPSPAKGKHVVQLTDKEIIEARLSLFHKVAGYNAEWISSGMRHTFASNHLAYYNDITRLVLELGHTDADLLWSNYHLHTKKSDSIEFWNIFPKS